MRPLFGSTDLDSSKIQQVIDESKYDKRHFNAKPDFKYYQFKGNTSAITNARDMRRGMVFGVLSTKLYTFVHVPQYKKVFKIPLKAANKLLLKSQVYTTQYYEEV